MPMEDQDRAQALQARQDLEEVWGGRTWEKDKGKEREREPEVSDPDGEHQTKWRRPSHKGKGPSQSSWAGWGNGRNQRQWREEKEGEAGSTSPRSQELLKCLVKMTVRHEQELMRIRPDVGFIGFCDTSENGCLAMLRSVSTEWSEKYAQGQVKTSLKVIMALSMMKDLKERADLTIREEDRLQRCLNVGWIVASENALNPAWVYHSWDSQAKKQILAETPPLKHSEAVRHIDNLILHLPKAGVLTRFASAKGQHMQAEYDMEVIPMMLQLGLRGAASDQCYEATQALSGCAIVKLQGVRWRPERATKPPLAKALEEAYLAMPYTDWGRRNPGDQWTKPSGANRAT